MNFTQLKNAVTVARCGSVNKAAAELYISQPCLSNSLKALEKELDFQVFIRSTRGVRLTEKGKKFIEISEEILKGLRRIEELSENKDIKPLTVSSYPLSYISNTFLKFRKKTSSKLNDTIREAGNLRVLEEVSEGVSVMGFVFFAADNEARLMELADGYKLRCEKLFSPIPMYAVAGRGHPIAKFEKITIEKLMSYPLVYLNDKSSRKFMESLGYRLNKNSFFTGDRLSVFDALRSGEYATFMSVTEQSKSNDYVYIPIEDKRLYMGIYYVVKKDYRLDKRERALLDFFKNEIKIL